MVVNGSWILNIFLKVEPVGYSDVICERKKGDHGGFKVFFCFWFFF